MAGAAPSAPVLAAARRQTTRYLLHDEATLAQVARDAIAFAGTISPGHATAFVQESAGITAKVRGGAVIAAERNGGQSLGVTIVDGGRTGRASTGIFTREAIRATVERAAFIASQVERDPDSQPADSAVLAYNTPDVPLYAPSGLDVGALAETAVTIEAEALSTRGDADTARVVEAGAGSSDLRWAQAIGPDFCRGASASSQGRWAEVIAERGGRMASGRWASSDRRVAALQSPAAIGGTAKEHATRKLGGRSLGTRDCPVLFDAPVAASLVGDLMQALFGMAQFHQSTFLPGALGTRPLAGHLDLIEDPFEPYGLSSGAFDSEGIAGARRLVVRGGQVEGYFLSTRSARKLGMASTGNAGGPWNVHLKSSRTRAGDDLPAMLRRVDRGLWVTELLGGEVHPVTGAYSKAAIGFWIENGAVAHPVEDITIAGAMPGMLAAIEHVGGDVHRSGGLRTGSILIAQMRVAGR